MTKRVEIRIEAHVADVMLNRADKLNALDMRMFEALGDAADQIAADPSVRAVVLRGDGDHFCTGIDLAVFGDNNVNFRDALKKPVGSSPANVFQRAAYAWRELPVPVICAIQGICYGGGLQVALGADIRIATPDAKLSIMESKWGIIPDMGISTTLRHLVAPDRVKELSWTGRILSGAEARDIGLVTAVEDDPAGACQKLALECAGRSPEAIRGIKSLVNQGWHLTDEDALALEGVLQAGIIGGANQIEAVAANLAGRQPDFED